MNRHITISILGSLALIAWVVFNGRGCMQQREVQQTKRTKICVEAARYSAEACKHMAY